MCVCLHLALQVPLQELMYLYGTEAAVAGYTSAQQLYGNLTILTLDTDSEPWDNDLAVPMGLKGPYTVTAGSQVNLIITRLWKG